MDEGERRGSYVATLRERRLWTREELAKRAGLTTSTVSNAEEGRGQTRFGTIRKLAEALEVEPLLILHPPEESAAPKATTTPSPEPSMRDELPEAWRLLHLRVIESSARALDALFAAEVERGEFETEDYDRTGLAFKELDSALESAMSNEYIRDEEAASEEEREAVNRAWAATRGLQNTLGHARRALLDRPSTTVTDLAEYGGSLEGAA